jgi:hypothetical protein
MAIGHCKKRDTTFARFESLRRFKEERKQIDFVAAVGDRGNLRGQRPRLQTGKNDKGENIKDTK